MDSPANRPESEIAHGKRLALGDTERIWGWGTTAGKRRAARRAALIARGARLQPGVSVLEIGCGTGLFTEKFAASGANVVALDISPELLEKARKRLPPSHRIVFQEGRFEKMQVHGRFDAVIGSSVLHHLELLPALRAIARVLKPGGSFSFAEPNYLNPQIFFTYKLRRLFPAVSPDEDAFYRWRLKNHLEIAGFAAVRLTPFDWLHPATPEPLIPHLERSGRFLERTPLLREFAGSLLICGRKPDA